MKKIKLFTFAALVAFLGFGLTSCGGYNNNKAKEIIKVHEKDSDKVKKEDYATMIEWYEEIQTDYLDQWEEIAKEEKKRIDYELALQEMEIDLLSDYPHFGRLVFILETADEDDMGKSNYNKFEKLKEKFDKREERIRKKAPDHDDD